MESSLHCFGSYPNNLWNWRSGTQIKSTDCAPNATVFLWVSTNNWMMHQLKEWLWCWISLFFSSIYFWHLIGGDEPALHSSVSILKKLSLVSLTSWMSASILFSSCLAHGIVNVLAFIFSLIKRDRYYCWLNQSNALNAHNQKQVCALGLFLKLCANVLMRDVC